MVKKLAVLAVAVFLLCNLYGCWFLIGGAAGGGGTVAWLSGKMTQEVSASYETTINATKSALQSFKFELTKEIKGKYVTQIRSRYTDGRDIRIDIHKISAKSSKIEIRIGTAGDKEVSAEILKRITSYL